MTTHSNSGLAGQAVRILKGHYKGSTGRLVGCTPDQMVYFIRRDRPGVALSYDGPFMSDEFEFISADAS